MNKEIKIGALLQYIQMGLSIVISFLYTPLMLRILGQAEYGLYNLASSIISYLSLLSLGFGASYIRYHTIYKKQFPERLKNLNGLYLFVFTAVGVIVLIAGVFLSFNVSLFFNSTYTPHDISVARVLMVFLSINLAISFPMSLFSSYVTSQEKFIFQKLLNMGKTVLSPAISIAALFLGYGSIGLVAVATLVSIIVDFVNVFYCFKKLRMRIALKNIEWGVFKDVFVFSLFIAINQIIDQINWQTDKIILGKMISASAVSVYAIGSVFNTYYIQFSTAISTLFIPKINRIVVSDKCNQNMELTKLMTCVGRIQFFVLALILLGFIFFGKPFIKLWAGPEYSESYYVALLLMIPETIPLIQNIGIEIQRAKNKHQFRSIVYLAMAIINVGISIGLVYRFGIIGAAVGTAISLIVANMLIMNVYYHMKMKINMLYFWKNILAIFPALIIPIISGILLSFVEIDSILSLAGSVITFSFIYVTSIFAFGLNQEEQSAVKKVLKL